MSLCPLYISLCKLNIDGDDSMSALAPSHNFSIVGQTSEIFGELYRHFLDHTLSLLRISRNSSRIYRAISQIMRYVSHYRPVFFPRHLPTTLSLSTETVSFLISSQRSIFQSNQANISTNMEDTKKCFRQKLYDLERDIWWNHWFDLGRRL